MTQDTIKPLIERLEELDAKRTPGDWGFHKALPLVWVEADEDGSPEDFHVAETKRDIDARFIATFANEALPALKAAQAEIDRLQAREAELVEALKPFAELDQTGAPFTYNDDSHGVYGRNETGLTVGDFRKARAALTTDGESHD